MRYIRFVGFLIFFVSGSYSVYAVDSDNDGIDDTVDLDDDNDGVSDIDETNCTGARLLWDASVTNGSTTAKFSTSTGVTGTMTSSAPTTGTFPAGYPQYLPTNNPPTATNYIQIVKNGPGSPTPAGGTVVIKFDKAVTKMDFWIRSIAFLNAGWDEKQEVKFFFLGNQITGTGIVPHTVTGGGGHSYDAATGIFNGATSSPEADFKFLIEQPVDRIEVKSIGTSDITGVYIGNVCVADNDGDGIPNHLDKDSDNDGIPDSIEYGGTDSDGDGEIDGFVDTNNDGMHDGMVTNPLPIPDTDADGLIDVFDIDSDNDGIPDLLEAGGADLDGNGLVDAFNDANNNGFHDFYQIIPLNAPDTDVDGIKDYLDLDSDGDGIVDLIEAGGVDADNDGMVDNQVDADYGGMDDGVEASPHAMPDSDNDGVKDVLDIDSDNDGIVDNIEGQSTSGYNPPLGTDADKDGLDDQYDVDVNPSNVITPVNTDNLGLPDYLDLDSDEDGKLDAVEGWDTDNDGTPNITPAGNDLDNDGLDDNYDNNDGAYNPTNGQVPNDFPDFTPPGGDRDWREFLADDNDGDGIADKDDLDDDNDGIPDIIEDANTDGDNDPATNPTDTDGDGVPDYFDLDADNDGVPDLEEGGGTDANNDGLVDNFTDANNDGWDDNTQLTTPTNTDGSGKPDFQDLDADNDGIADVVEAGGTDANGDGLIDNFTDTDQNGLNDSPVFGNPKDTDGDGDPDYQDLDADGDGINDVIEGGGVDPNNDGVIGSGTATDTDGDGLLDEVDTDNGGDVLPIPDTDGDGEPDFQDVDSDGDSVEDVDENDVNNDGTLLDDTDGDGIPDYIDTDDDGDGANTIEEWDADGDGIGPDDCDGDKIPNYLDADRCQLFIPAAISPNGDGKNDMMVIKGLEFYQENSFTIFNRWGDKVYSAAPYKNDWSGKSMHGIRLGDQLPEGTYYYILDLGVEEQGQPRYIKSFVLLQY